MPCGCDCTHWCCWWLPLPSHFFFLLFLFYLSIAALPGVRVCKCVLVEREKGMFHTATAPASCQQLKAGGCLFVLVAEGRRVCHCACGCSSSSLALAVLCCLLVPPCHMVLTPSRHHHHACHGIVA